MLFCFVGVRLIQLFVGLFIENVRSSQNSFATKSRIIFNMTHAIARSVYWNFYNDGGSLGLRNHKFIEMYTHTYEKNFVSCSIFHCSWDSRPIFLFNLISNKIDDFLASILWRRHLVGSEWIIKTIKTQQQTLSKSINLVVIPFDNLNLNYCTSSYQPTNN